MKASVFLLIGLGLLITGVAIWLGFYKEHREPVTIDVRSFEECVAAGYPVLESYPEQCKTPDGRTYAKEYPAPEPTYTDTTADMIRVINPTPGSVTSKEFTVVGEARGGWYFEASFPIEVRDANGTVIATGSGKAQGDWMTTDLVPFMADIKVPDSFIGPATLILKKDNPSGMPENDASVSFSFTIEY